MENSTIAEWEATPVLINSFTQTYDDAGKLAARTNVRFDSPWPITYWTTYDQFSYNEHNEISMGSLYGSTNYYAYDNIGNRNGSTIEVNDLNQYHEYGSSFENEYDWDGNLTADGTWRYKWNAENQLVEMWTYHDPDSPQYNDKKISFTYDYMGRRVKKTYDVYSGGSWSEQKRTDFIYDGWNVIYEKETVSTSTTVKHYVWGLDLSGSLQGAGGVGGLAAVFIDNTTTPIIPLYDANGNIMAYTDLLGFLKAQFYYDAFGNVTERTDGYYHTPDLFNFRFSTKYQDFETDLNYYGHRYYKPSWGRWLNPDPIGERGGLNLYGFVGNAPSMFTDALGLASEARKNVIKSLPKETKRALCCALKAQLDDPIKRERSGSFYQETTFHIRKPNYRFVIGGEQSHIENAIGPPPKYDDEGNFLEATTGKSAYDGFEKGQLRWQEWRVLNYHTHPNVGNEQIPSRADFDEARYFREIVGKTTGNADSIYYNTIVLTKNEIYVYDKHNENKIREVFNYTSQKWEYKEFIDVVETYDSIGSPDEILGCDKICCDPSPAARASPQYQNMLMIQ